MNRRRAGILVALVLVLALVGLGWWRRQQLLDERDAARVARVRAVTALDVARRALEATVQRAGEVELANVGTQREAADLRTMADGVAHDIETVTRERDDAVLAAFVANGQLGTLRTCLDGINRALNQVSVGDPGSVVTLGSVRSACRAVA